MKIFYGVQGTGNGHVTRARVLAPALKVAGLDVTYLFSGRNAEEYFDMEVFGDYRTARGLTFSSANGRVSYLKTLLHNSTTGFVKEIRELDLNDYDVVITYYEPVSAWAAKLQKKTVIGIGHQYAFSHKIPKAQPFNPSHLLLGLFAPVNIAIGVHWHHYDGFILPPIIERQQALQSQRDKIIVYLPFENPYQVREFLSPFKDRQFHVYTDKPDLIENAPEHLHFKKTSRKNFQNDMRDCAGIICNAGFELPSESLQLGKKLLVKPLDAQVEQLSNALALQKLDYATVMNSLDKSLLEKWLDRTQTVKADYPDVAGYIVDWLQAGEWNIGEEWIKNIWQHVSVEAISY